MSLETLQIALVPLGAVWIIAKTLLDASTFVNQLRETVVIGWKDGKELTLVHRKTLRKDWYLTMGGVLSTCALFSGAMFWATVVIERTPPAMDATGAVVAHPALAHLLFVVGVFSVVGMFSFLTCGWWDHQLMRETLRAAESAEATSA